MNDKSTQIEMTTMSTLSTRAIRIASVVAIIAVLMLLGAVVADACPSCGFETVKGQKGGADLADGFAYSIVGMASAPFIVFTSIAAYVIRKYRQRSRS